LIPIFCGGKKKKKKKKGGQGDVQVAKRGEGGVRFALG